MKKIFIYIIGLFVGITMVASCLKDKGNYDYNWENNIIVDSLKKNYTVVRGNDLQIKPAIYMYNKGNEIKATDYTHLWVAYTDNSNITPPIADTIGTEMELNYNVQLAAGNYLLECQVIDKKSGLVWKKATNLTVKMSGAQGWVFLEEDAEGYADISMLTYNPVEKDYRLNPSLLSVSGIDRELRKSPKQICVLDNYIKPGHGVWFVTENVTGYLDYETGHSWAPSNIMANHLMESVEDTYSVKKLIQAPLAFVYAFTKDNNLRISPNIVLLFSDNLCYTQEETFEIAPFVGARQMFSIEPTLFYDQTKKRFLLLRINYSWQRLNDLPTGFDMVFMSSLGSPGNETAYCLMKKEGQFSVFQISPNEGKMKTNVSLGSTANMLNASFYTFHQNNQQLYYSKGNKLFVNKAGVEFEVNKQFDGEITCLFTRTFQNTHMLEHKHLLEFKNYLVVAAKTPAGGAKISFLVPKEGYAEQMTEVYSLELPNKVVSIDYQTDFKIQ